MRKSLRFILPALIVLSLAATALADTTPTPTPSATPKPTPNIACIGTAVNTREVAIQAALDTFYGAEKAALQARQSALNSAWTITNAKQRNAAIKTAWSNFSQANKAARAAFKTAKNTAWSQFQTSVKACKAGTSGESLVSELNF